MRNRTGLLIVALMVVGLLAIGSTVGAMALTHSTSSPWLIPLNSKPFPEHTLSGQKCAGQRMPKALSTSTICYCVVSGSASSSLTEAKRIYPPSERSVKRSLAGLTNGGSRKRMLT